MHGIKDVRTFLKNAKGDEDVVLHAGLVAHLTLTPSFVISANLTAESNSIGTNPTSGHVFYSHWNGAA